MSVIRKEPFIEKMLKKMNEEEKADLQTLMNVSGGNINASLSNLPEKGITPVYFNFENGTSIKTGILVYTDDHISLGGEQCVLLAYHKYQDISIYSIDLSNNTFRRVNEYCDINELRRAIDDAIKQEVINIDTHNNVSFGKNVEVDGDLTVNGSFNGKQKLSSLTLSEDTSGYISEETFTNHVRVLIEIDTESTHAGTDIILHPYGVSECFVAFTLLLGVEYVNSYAFLDKDGKVHIAIPEGVTPTAITGHYIEYKD